MEKLSKIKYSFPGLCTFSVCGVLVGVILTLLWLRLDLPFSSWFKYFAKIKFTQPRRVNNTKVSHKTRNIRARARANLKRKSR